MYQPSAEEKVLSVLLQQKKKEASEAAKQAAKLERELNALREANLLKHYGLEQYQKLAVNEVFLEWSRMHQDAFEYRYLRRFRKFIEVEDVGTDAQGDYAIVFIGIERWSVPLEILSKMEKVADESV